MANPRTIMQKEIVAECEHIQPLTSADLRDFYLHGIPHYYKRYGKKNTYCFDCGHVWEMEGKAPKRLVCPNCGATLKLSENRHVEAKGTRYVARSFRHGKYQVVQTYRLWYSTRRKAPMQYGLTEVYQWWINGKGRQEVIGYAPGMSSYWGYTWSWNSEFKLRKGNKDYYGDIRYSGNYFCPIEYAKVKSVIPELKRNGFKGSTYSIAPRHFFNWLLEDNRFETLLKARQISLLQYIACQGERTLNDIWPQIKIALRHNYKVADPSVWHDMIKNLRGLGKDIHNPKYICSTALYEDHDKWMKAERKRQEREERRRQQEQAEQRRLYIQEQERRYKEDEKWRNEGEKMYAEAKGKFFGIAIKSNNILITPLKTIQEFLEEGQKQNICVYTNGYYKIPDSLILHALVDGEITETIEVNLKTMAVVQCRGKHNQPSKYHDQILNLMKANINEIAKRNKAEKAPKAESDTKTGEANIQPVQAA